MRKLGTGEQVGGESQADERSGDRCEDVWGSQLVGKGGRASGRQMENGNEGALGVGYKDTEEGQRNKLIEKLPCLTASLLVLISTHTKDC